MIYHELSDAEKSLTAPVCGQVSEGSTALRRVRLNPTLQLFSSLMRHFLISKCHSKSCICRRTLFIKLNCVKKLGINFLNGIFLEHYEGCNFYLLLPSKFSSHLYKWFKCQAILHMVYFFCLPNKPNKKNHQKQNPKNLS